MMRSRARGSPKLWRFARSYERRELKGRAGMCHVYYTCMAISQHWVQFLCDGVYDV